VSGAAILLVEDDPSTRSVTARYLRGVGHPVVEAGNATGALEAWDAGRPDLVVLDLGLPDRDGLTVIRRIRSEAMTPILVLSARDREEDKVAALDLGADDYVTKPFGMAELRARVDALLRRAAGPAADTEGRISIRNLTVDLAGRVVEVDGAVVHLTPREYEVLKVLLAHAGHLVTHARLLRAVWGTAYGDEAHYVHVYVSQVRRKLAEHDPAGRLEGLITAEPGVGYRVAGA
jgi:two-component system KDP operon response regulator KdpE